MEDGEAFVPPAMDKEHEVLLRARLKNEGSALTSRVAAMWEGRLKTATTERERHMRVVFEFGNVTESLAAAATAVALVHAVTVMMVCRRDPSAASFFAWARMRDVCVCVRESVCVRERESS